MKVTKTFDINKLVESKDAIINKNKDGTRAIIFKTLMPVSVNYKALFAFAVHESYRNARITITIERDY